ncbi:D-hydantoinase/dihydropyrimidinase [Anaerolineae bacterium]|nr:D-hydantoinase/dihydropyrimidinase [Anaerolineae bacterium]
MKRIGYYTLVALFVVVGLALLALTNLGLLTFRAPYVESIPTQSAHPAIAFTNVNVVPMDRERVLQNQTVLVRNGVIEKIGERLDVPTDALTIDGTNKYLMPGLVDMHVHLQDKNDLILLAANGVTTVRNMWGNTDVMLRLGMPDQLQLREQIKQGKLFGPTIYTTGPVMEGDPSNHPLMSVFRTPQEAEQSVAWQKAQGYDFVKVYDHLNLETYRAIVRAAKQNGIPVVGHVPKAGGIDEVLTSGQVTIEHLQGYIDADAAEFLIAPERIAEYANKTRAAGVWNAPTLALYPKNSLPPEEIAKLEKQVAMKYTSPSAQLTTRILYDQMSQGHTYKGADYATRIAALNKRMMKALREADARFILGTDASNPYHILGFSAHEELAAMVEAGLTPYEALVAGTRNAAEALGKSSEFGTVTEGKRADLILVEANPLDDVTNANKRIGVVLRGQWLPEQKLQVMLNGLVESYTPTWIERVLSVVLIVAGVGLVVRRQCRA